MEIGPIELYCTYSM